MDSTVTLIMHGLSVKQAKTLATYCHGEMVWRKKKGNIVACSKDGILSKDVKIIPISNKANNKESRI